MPKKLRQKAVTLCILLFCMNRILLLQKYKSNLKHLMQKKIQIKSPVRNDISSHLKTSLNINK